MMDITEKELRDDLDIEKNVEISFDDISKITHEEKDWGSVVYLEYEKRWKKRKVPVFNCTRLGKVSSKRAYKIHESRLETFCAIY